MPFIVKSFKSTQVYVIYIYNTEGITSLAFRLAFEVNKIIFK